MKGERARHTSCNLLLPPVGEEQSYLGRTAEMLTTEKKQMSTSSSNQPAPEKQPGSSRRSWWSALLQQRCPRCREGRMFKGMAAMNDPCPVCGLVFEREPGYFFGAMYFSYFIAVAILVPLWLLAGWLFPDLDPLLVPLVAFIP